MTWHTGQVVARREIWRGRPWAAVPVVVVEDRDDLLATYLPEEAPFAFPQSADGRPHPWLGRGGWTGHGVLMLQRPGEAYAVWHFWNGPARTFEGWYMNLQEPFRRTAVGFDTQDLELDVWVPTSGAWSFKDEDLLEERVADGRFTRAQADAILRLGREIGRLLDDGGRWWDEDWASWSPEPTWRAPAFPPGWEHAAAPPAPPPDELRVL